MKDFIKENKNFTPEMTKKISHDLIKKINSMKPDDEEVLIVAQAMLKEEDRQNLRQYFPDIKFIQVTCEQEIAIRRVKQRQCSKSQQADKLVSETYARKIHQAYQQKGHAQRAGAYPQLVNDGNPSHLISQVEELVNQFIEKTKQWVADYMEDLAQELLTAKTKQSNTVMPGQVNDVVLPGCGIVSSSYSFFHLPSLKIANDKRAKCAPF